MKLHTEQVVLWYCITMPEACNGITSNTPVPLRGKILINMLNVIDILNFVPCKSITAHPNHETIASSQGQDSTTANNTGSSFNVDVNSIKNDGSHGQIHVRVWAVDDLSTLYTFGSGTFQGTVRKMQFMNYQVKIRRNV